MHACTRTRRLQVITACVVQVRGFAKSMLEVADVLEKALQVMTVPSDASILQER